jgi:putative transposase
MSFWRLYYHLVWATKNREQLIRPEAESQLYAYVVAKAAEMDVYVYAINGWYDHVHLVVSIPPKHSVADVVRRLKGASAHYLNHAVHLDYHFAWQDTYGVLSLGERQRPVAEAYVAGQKDHHENQTVNPWLEKQGESSDYGDDSGQVPDDSRDMRERRTPYIASEEAAF